MKNCEIMIIGQGPAGLSSAIYTGRGGMRTIIAGCDPKVAGDYQIDNYFGFSEVITGRELIARGVLQARKFGTEILCDKVLKIVMDEDGQFTVKTENETYRSCAVILATGVSRRKPKIGDLEKFEGRGVSYCVSCDGFFFRGKNVIVAGEGTYAANQALELLSYTPNVKIATMGKGLKIDEKFSASLKSAGIEIIEQGIAGLKGGQVMEALVLDDGRELKADGLFLALGDASSTDFAYSLGVITSDIFIKVNENQETNVPGVFAAGDCTGGFLQISVAVGEGAKAARSAMEYVKKRCRGAKVDKG